MRQKTLSSFTRFSFQFKARRLFEWHAALCKRQRQWMKCGACGIADHQTQTSHGKRPKRTLRLFVRPRTGGSMATTENKLSSWMIATRGASSWANTLQVGRIPTHAQEKSNEERSSYNTTNSFVSSNYSIDDLWEHDPEMCASIKVNFKIVHFEEPQTKRQKVRDNKAGGSPRSQDNRKE